MNAYQQKWVQLFQDAHIADWKVKAQVGDIEIFVPGDVGLKIVRDNLPQTIAAMPLDIIIPKHRLKFILHNGHANTGYILNPTEAGLNEA